MLESDVLDRIRAIFLHPRPHVDLSEATALLGWSGHRMREAIKAGEIEVCRTSIGEWVWREELMAKALETWPRETIEAALGVAVETVLPFHVQLTDLHARVPRYQLSMLEYLAGQHRTTVSDVLTRELDGIASEHADELTAALPGFGVAIAWPDFTPAKWSY
jgi:hypothetical protein